MDLILTACLLLSCTIQYAHSAAVHTTPPHITHATPKPTHEPDRWHNVWFHYNRWSLEHILLMETTGNNCYCMPLSAKDVQDTQHPASLSKLEIHLISQVAKGNMEEWTRDDLAVRDSYWGVKKCQGKIYRVYRI